MGDASVRVICRFRPINAREQREEVDDDKSKAQIKFVNTDTIDIIQPGKEKLNFTFDRVFHSNALQQDIFNLAAKDTVDDVLQGYNGTIFAYGQTGAGKSFTMFGPDISEDDMKGIIPRACSHIFQHIAEDTSGTEYTIKCSFLEIYKEVIRDLLNPKGNNLKVRETPSKGVWVDELSEVFVTCEQEVLDLIKLGEKFRAVSSTQMNAVSSRSHSLFILSLTQKSRDGTTKMGKLNLADLAGSEKVGKTGASGETLEEAKKINQSLSALGNCINALTKAKKGHVPYRDSKLTFILRESLGGNAKTTLVIACSPHAFNLEETISTLRFGQRAKSIKNKAKINQERSVAELEAIIDKMRAEITKLRAYNEALERELVAAKGSDFNIDEFRKKLMGDLAKRQQQVEPPTSPRPRGDGDDDASSVASDDSDASNTNLDVPSREPSSTQFLSPMPTKTRPNLLTPQTPSTPTHFGGNSIPATPSSPSPFANFDAYDPMAMIEMQLAYDKLKEEKDIQIQDLKEELSQLREELERAKAQQSTEETKSEDNSSLVAQLESQKQEFEAHKSKMEYEAKQSALQMETATSSLAILKEDNENLRQTLDKTTGKVSELSQENETLKEQKNELELKIKTMESQVQQLNQRVSSFEQNATAHAQEKQESLKQQQEKDENIQKLQESIAVLEDDYNALTGEMNEAQGKIKVLIQEKELLETALTTAKHTISVLEQSRAAAEKDKSVPGTPRNDLLDTANKKISDLSNSLDQQVSENSLLKKKVSLLETDVDKLKAENANKERKMEQERQKSKTANDTLKALKKELNEMKMVQQQIAFDSEKTLKEAEIKLLTEQNQRLSTQTDLERLKRVLVERDYEVKQLNENLSKVTLSFKEESAKRATTTKQLDENSKRLTELEKNIESLQEENSKLKAMLKNNKNNTSAKPAATTDISGISKLSEAEKETSTALTEFVRRLQQRSGRVVRPVQSSSLSSGQNSPQVPANNNAPSGTMDSILHFWKEDVTDTSNMPVEKEGWLTLQEQEDKFKVWKRRWTVIKANRMFYYVDRHAKDPVSFVKLNGCKVQRADEQTRKPNSFLIVHKENESIQPANYIYTNTDEQCQDWIDFLTKKFKTLEGK